MKDYKKDIEQPAHYRRHQKEVIEATRLAPGNISNSIKYLLRAGVKEGEAFEKDLGKCRWYVSDLLKNHRAFSGYPMPYLWASIDALQEMQRELNQMVVAEQGRSGEPVTLNGQREKHRADAITSIISILESLRMDGSIAIRSMFITELLTRLTVMEKLVDENQQD